MVIKVAIDQGANQRLLRPLQRRGLVELRQANHLEQTWPGLAEQQKKGFTLGHSALDGPDVLADEKAEELERILGLDKRLDIAHVYAAYLNGCEYFVTEDVAAFIRGGRREALESLLGLKVRRTGELIQELAQE
jgi:hypothetical protein